jgi:hypothetical protein
MAIKVIALILPRGLDTFAVSASLGIAGRRPGIILSAAQAFALA